MSIIKPFIYFSEFVLTPSRNLNIITANALQFGATPRLDWSHLWTEAALSVRSQAQLQRLPGYRGEKFNKWLKGCVDSLAANCEFAEPANVHGFRSALMTNLFRPNSYMVPETVRTLLKDLESNGIGWGVIANDSHLYLAVLKSLQLVPKGPIIQAQGPEMFKPLPKMWHRAVQKAPVASKHNLWFVGSKSNPCDNFNANPYIRSALVAPELAESETVSAHFRVRNVDDLRPYWFSPAELIDFAPAPAQPSDSEELTFTEYRPKLPAKPPTAEASLRNWKLKNGDE